MCGLGVFFFLLLNITRLPDPWRFDFTRVYEGSSRAEIDQARKRGGERFEIEVECADFEGYSCRHTDAYIAESICLKMADFMVSDAVRVTSQ